MKITFNGGIISLTAENKEENKALFEFGNEMNFTPTGRARTTYKKQAKEGHSRKPRHTHICDVIGCEKHVKSLSLHKLMAHGIHKDGTVTETVEFSKGTSPVTQPVVKLPNGTYRMVKTGGLLA